MNSFEILNKWYTLHCDGLWEHSLGVVLETIDNPGYSLSINLQDTCLSGKDFKKNLDNSDFDWYDISIQNNKFVAMCSSNNLEECIRIFKDEFLKDNIDNDYIYQCYLKLENTNEFIKVKTVMTDDLSLKFVGTLDDSDYLSIPINSNVQTYLTTLEGDTIRAVRL